MAVISSQIRPTRNQEQTSLDAGFWARLYSRFGGYMGFGLAAFAVVIGWSGRDSRSLTAEEGIGYFLGIVALICMTILLVYPLRKRLRFLKFLGATKDWFRTHMILGTLVPLAAVYHCNYQLGSFNSRVALFSALIMTGSGFVGRLIYSKIHVGLYGRRATLSELLKRIDLAAPSAARVAQFVPELTKRIREFDKEVLVPPKSIFACMTLPIRLSVRTRRQQWKLMRFVRRRLRLEAMYSPLLSQHGKKLEKITRQYIATHLGQVRKVAAFTAYQRLFALWHSIHRPFFVVLFVTVFIHVFAVHYY